MPQLQFSNGQRKKSAQTIKKKPFNQIGGSMSAIAQAFGGNQSNMKLSCNLFGPAEQILVGVDPSNNEADNQNIIQMRQSMDGNFRTPENRGFHPNRKMLRTQLKAFRMVQDKVNIPKPRRNIPSFDYQVDNNAESNFFQANSSVPGQTRNGRRFDSSYEEQNKKSSFTTDRLAQSQHSKNRSFKNQKPNFTNYISQHQQIQIQRNVGIFTQYVGSSETDTSQTIKPSITNQKEEYVQNGPQRVLKLNIMKHSSGAQNVDDMIEYSKTTDKLETMTLGSRKTNLHESDHKFKGIPIHTNQAEEQQSQDTDILNCMEQEHGKVYEFSNQKRQYSNKYLKNNIESIPEDKQKGRKSQTQLLNYNDQFSNLPICGVQDFDPSNKLKPYAFQEHLQNSKKRTDRDLYHPKENDDQSQDAETTNTSAMLPQFSKRHDTPSPTCVSGERSKNLVFMSGGQNNNQENQIDKRDIQEQNMSFSRQLKKYKTRRSTVASRGISCFDGVTQTNPIIRAGTQESTYRLAKNQQFQTSQDRRSNKKKQDFATFIENRAQEYSQQEHEIRRLDAHRLSQEREKSLSVEGQKEKVTSPTTKKEKSAPKVLNCSMKNKLAIEGLISEIDTKIDNGWVSMMKNNDFSNQMMEKLCEDFVRRGKDRIANQGQSSSFSRKKMRKSGIPPATISSLSSKNRNRGSFGGGKAHFFTKRDSVGKCSQEEIDEITSYQELISSRIEEHYSSKMLPPSPTRQQVTIKKRAILTSKPFIRRSTMNLIRNQKCGQSDVGSANASDFQEYVRNQGNMIQDPSAFNDYMKINLPENDPLVMSMQSPKLSTNYEQLQAIVQKESSTMTHRRQRQNRKEFNFQVTTQPAGLHPRPQKTKQASFNQKQYQDLTFQDAVIPTARFHEEDVLVSSKNAQTQWDRDFYNLIIDAEQNQKDQLEEVTQMSARFNSSCEYIQIENPSKSSLSAIQKHSIAISAMAPEPLSDKGSKDYEQPMNVCTDALNDSPFEFGPNYYQPSRGSSSVKRSQKSQFTPTRSTQSPQAKPFMK